MTDDHSLNVSVFVFVIIGFPVDTARAFGDFSDFVLCCVAQMCWGTFGVDLTCLFGLYADLL